MPDIVISNTSPIFYLHRLGQLELLHRLYGRILVPEAVFEELKAGRDQGEDVPDVANHDWIEIHSLTRQLDMATGGTGEEQSVSPLPGPSASPKRVATKLMQCERCGANVALLIFADDATDSGGLEDYTRLMYSKVVELNVPTWVIGPPIESEPSPESPADILKIWPEREAIRQLRPDEFNPIIEALATTHCRVWA